MSPIGRIFVVVNLILAAVFVGWASANLAESQQYRRDAEAAEAELARVTEEKDAEIAQLEAARDEAVRERASMLEQKNAVDARNTSLTQDLEAANSRNAELAASLDTIEATLGDYSSTIDQLRSDLTTAQSERVDAVEAKRDAQAEREDALAAQRAAEELAAERQRDIAELQVELTEAEGRIQSLDTLVATFKEVTGLSEAELGGVVPQIDGAVLGVYDGMEPGLVHINKGSADGVKRGYTFHLFSGSQYKGRARVEVVNDNTCTAVVLDTVDGRTIEQGDSAATNI